MHSRQDRPRSVSACRHDLVCTVRWRQCLPHGFLLPAQPLRQVQYRIQEQLMKFKQLSMAISGLCVCASASADMAGAKLAIVYDAGGKFDKSFNQSAAEGVTRFMKETGVKV